MKCKNCNRSIAQRWILKKYWYHIDTGREQCQYNNFMNIDIATPRETE